MKNLTAVLVGVTLMLGGLCATASAKVEVSGDVYAGVASKYMWRGFDLSGSQPVAQGGMDVSAGDFTFSYWTNLQLGTDTGESFQSGETTETDIVIDYSKDLGEMVAISVGNVFYQLEGIDDTNELYLSVGLNTLLIPTLTAYYDWDAADEAGLFYTLSIGHDITIIEPLTLSLGALVSYNQSSDYSVGDYDDFHNYELSAGLEYAVTEQIALSAGFIFSEGISDDAKDSIDSLNSGNSEMVSSLSVAFNF